MNIETNQYSRIIFLLKISLLISAFLLFFVIFIFSYSKNLTTDFSVITKDVRVGLKYQAREAHVTGITSAGDSFDFHVEALNPSHKNDKIIILSRPLGELFFSENERFNFSSDFATLNFEEENIVFSGNLAVRDAWGTSIKTDELYADLKDKILIGSKPLIVKTIFGSLKSGGMKYFYGIEEKGQNEEIFFSKGVKFELSVDGER